MIHSKEVNQNLLGKVSLFCLLKGGTGGLALHWNFLTTPDRHLLPWLDAGKEGLLSEGTPGRCPPLIGLVIQALNIDGSSNYVACMTF